MFLGGTTARDTKVALVTGLADYPTYVRAVVNCYTLMQLLFIVYGLFHFTWWHAVILVGVSGLLSGLPLGYMRRNGTEYAFGQFFMIVFVIACPIMITLLYLSVLD